MSKCSQNMWPLKLDMSKEECRGVLRRLELDAYSSVVSTFRAQGSLDSSKQNVLDQLRRCFHISEDRHKAEVRRVANSEKLTTISELLNGRSHDLEWIREGHRNYPLIGRAPPYSALHILAEHAAKAAAIENSDLPHPSDTRRARTLDEEIAGKPITTEDPTLPPSSPAVFGISRKDLKKSLDISALHQSTRKKHYQHLKPPPPPNVKIQHLYQTLNAKRPRKSLTKKPLKVRATKQSPGRMMHLPYHDDKHFDGAELQRHLTSQLMPPPMSPMKSPYAPILPAGKKDTNLLSKMCPLEPQAHYIPNHPTRLKSELLGEPSKGRSARSKNANTHARSNYQQKYANGSGARNVHQMVEVFEREEAEGSLRAHKTISNMDHIPDPQIIFNTTSSKLEQAMEPMQMDNNHDMDLSTQGMASPLQLLSTAASFTQKLKVTPHAHHQQQQSLSSSPTIASLNPAKTVQNRAIKIIPAPPNTKPMVIKPAPEAGKTTRPIVTTAQSGNFKIQKIQLLMNKSQEGTSTAASLSPSATIVSGKAGQLVLSGKNFTNSYQVAGKPPYTKPYTIVGTQNSNSPKVIVQTIDRMKDSESSIPENQRITENTPIEFMSANLGLTSYPKVIIQKSPATKQIKLKLGTTLPKILKGSIPTNLKIQRNISTKGFTVLNSSQIVQLQAQAQAVVQTVVTEGTKVDWEQELDDVNRTKGGKSSSKSNGAGSTAKKMRFDEDATADVESCQVEDASSENVIVETVVDPSTSLIEFENQPQEEVVPMPTQSEIVDVVSEYVFLNHDEEVAPKSSEEAADVPVLNGEESATVNGQDERKPQNGAEAYENLVKSLTECDGDYMKDIAEDAQDMDENFGLIDEGNILETFGFTRESGLFQ